MITRNPYLRGRQVSVNASTGEPMPGTFRPVVRNGRRQVMASRSEPLVGNNGEFNAGSKQELMQQIGAMIENHRSGDLVKAHVQQVDPTIRAQRAAIVQAAANDKSGPAFQVLGEVETKMCA